MSFGKCWEWPGVRNALGYGMVRGQGKYLRAHRVMWELANGPVPEGLGVLHRCDNPSCMRLTHLFLGTQTDNIRDMNEKGRYKGGWPNGERARSAKLTGEKVRDIRKEWTAGILTQVQLAKKYDVRQGSISAVITRKTWKHIA